MPNQEYLFITTCSMTKTFNGDAAIPLVDMYSGRVFHSRYNLLKLVSNEIYFCTPSGPGIVRDDWMSKPYNQMTPNSKLKLKEFQQYHRKLFEDRYPGRLEHVKTIFWLGSGHYSEFLTNVFYDKEVISCFVGKLSAGRMSSFIDHVIRDVAKHNVIPISHEWVENDTHIFCRYVSKEDGFAKNKVNLTRYRKTEMGLEEDFDYSLTQFAMDLVHIKDPQEFQEMLNSLNWQAYKGPLIDTFWMRQICKKYNISWHTEPLPNKIIPYNYLDSNILHPKFVKILKKLK